MKTMTARFPGTCAQTGARIMPTIYTHDNPADGLAVDVTADWTVGKFRVQFRDTDAGAIIETRTYSNPDAAIAYARKLIGE